VTNQQFLALIALGAICLVVSLVHAARGYFKSHRSWYRRYLKEQRRGR